jgi:cytochrome c oxidase subunit 2
MAFQARNKIGGMMLSSALWALMMGTAFADSPTPGMGEPEPWQMGLQGAATPVMEYIVWFHTYVMWFIVPITLFVMVLLLYVIFRFNKKANPIPSKVTHHTGIEIAWTVIPILILVAIAIPSFRLLFLEQTIPNADLTIKATASQWSWDYEYPDNGDFTFTSVMRKDEAKVKAEGLPWLLAVDNEVVVPVNKIVRVQVTGTDVVHAFAVPSFGIKIDAIPGRLNETWFQATREGWYYGQCSQLCGHDHAYMPIAVHVVSDDDFQKWVAGKKAAMNGTDSNKVASAAAIIQ